MSNFEKIYYESPKFWENGILEDPNNLERIKKTIEFIPSDTKSLLDAGCGNGLFLNTLSRANPLIKLQGIDRSSEAIKHVLVPCQLGDISNIVFENETFDCTTCLEVIEHIPHKSYTEALLELARVTKKYIIISVPFEEDLSINSTQCPECKSCFNSNLHLRRYDEEAFKKILENTKFIYKGHFLCGASENYKYHNLYRKIFYPNQFKKWNSPICPVCGYDETETLEEKNSSAKKEKVFFIKSFFTYIPKKLWPKETKNYWIVGLFEKMA